MRIVLLRHAERDNTGGEDPGLSSRGSKQALQLAGLVEKNQLFVPQKLLASPKKRTQLTLQPVAKKSSRELFIEAALDERIPSESMSEFKNRIAKFLQKIESQKIGNLFFCSHLDWIEEAMVLIPSDNDLLQEKYQIWQPGQYMEFEINDGMWNLISAGKI